MHHHHHRRGHLYRHVTAADLYRPWGEDRAYLYLSSYLRPSFHQGQYNMR